jgi:hypothetical protein
VKHVCVAARIGDGKAPGAGNSHSIAKASNAASRGGRSRFQAYCAWMQPRSTTLSAPNPRALRTPTRSHPHKRGPCSALRRSLLRAAVRRRFWLQPFGLARVLACSPRLSAQGFCCWGGDGGQVAHVHSVGYGTVPANGPAANESRRHIVASHLLRMTKPRALLRVLSQNRDSASRVPLCYGLLVSCKVGPRLLQRQTRYTSLQSDQHCCTWIG